ncbi:leucyl aminopeptidase [Nitratifractor salsuginis]|uniref:Probable cytosol aminopeptidase n=1 Tax=Nitratifractor salsuginis (strain DSM 16511 / JCM 12458 / E9I37-1) TaxID=749222 RepID=E6X1E4_NITSE|nr:leucyl aminopeptidase [Nitratifractor salsuginis]ADV45877.1 peptidase M17 leucyl aminopeptidase domain protein [Nitratifractor salsuginis DSM 16511]
MKLIKFYEKLLNEIEADIEIVIVINKNFDQRFVDEDKELLQQAGFSGDQDETCLLAEKGKLYVGADSINSADIRSAAANAVRALNGKGYKIAKMGAYMSHPSCTATLRAQAEGLLLGGYRFERYKSKHTDKHLHKVRISLEEYNGYALDIPAAQRAIDKAIVSAEATNFVRDIVNTAPDDCYPETMAQIAAELAQKESRLNLEVLGPKEMREEGMNALLAVGRASRHEPRLIHLSYTPKETPVATVSLIGKGLTYDSGGLSLKPSDFMVTMKADKSGGSAVLGILKAVAELHLPIEVHGFVGAVENMIGGDAYKPDDVLKAKNGKTIEVRNTDAEGRLVLADVLCYAQEKVKADYIFDLATLTGACVVGVGQYTSGVMGFGADPVNRVLYAANTLSGELATKLDFNRFLRKTLKSEIADICNISNTRYGGAITAGMFLGEFIDEDHKEKWAHIDIAGPAFVEHAWGENPHGASGAGVRMMTRLLEKLARGDAHA